MRFWQPVSRCGTEPTCNLTRSDVSPLSRLCGPRGRCSKKAQESEELQSQLVREGQAPQAAFKGPERRARKNVEMHDTREAAMIAAQHLTNILAQYGLSDKTLVGLQKGIAEDDKPQKTLLTASEFLDRLFAGMKAARKSISIGDQRPLKSMTREPRKPPKVRRRGGHETPRRAKRQGEVVERPRWRGAT